MRIARVFFVRSGMFNHWSLSRHFLSASHEGHCLHKHNKLLANG